MTLRPPPLQWLPAFEAAARLGSFSRAAENLHVSTSAIGQQIRQLEAYLGHPLFIRNAQGVRLTDFGRAYAVLAAEVLETYRLGHARLLQRPKRAVLRLSTTPLVAHEFLLPSLSTFQQLHPQFELRIESTMTLADFASQKLDAAIRYGHGAWPGLVSWPLSRCWATLVASPALVAENPVREVADLSKHTLIHQREQISDWQTVAQVFGVTEVPHQADLRLDSNLSALRAAESGLGIAIAVWPLVQPWLADGRLVAVLPWVSLSTGDHFVCRRADPRQDMLQAVYGWLRGLFDQYGNAPTQVICPNS